ncbi:phosphate transport system permease protein PstA [Desulfocucumis palustris]|uniref:Phosphate transport system permease protein PstA n=1 Tax=Desulfocucumis palustris TaxID=1898651 RepID=A0A2L2XH87_9FIRM|nr:phosphate ABC transporter permease PstA [Desulfocucumis palustris]GBF33241.1 phosphate transport system permease protein PstA [Desulfocucumis palustris]
MKIIVLVEEKLAKIFLWASVLITIGSLLAIMIHILGQGLAVVSWDFLTGSSEDMGRRGGIFPSIVTTLYLIGVSLAFAAPVGVLSAVFLTEYASKKRIIGAIKFATETLAGIPSIIFGLFGFAFLVIFMGFSWSILSGGITVALMILPTIIRTTEEAIKTVPKIYREGSLALGATKWQTICRIVLPTALPGIFTGIILSIGRVVGETAAILLTAGNSLNIPTSVMDPGRSLSIHLYLLAFEGVSLRMAYGTATVLILLILVINMAANILMNKMASKTSM